MSGYQVIIDGRHRVEEWQPIAGFPGYEVSNLGRVRHGECIPIRDTSGSGYPRVWLTGTDGRGVRRDLHQVVAEAFHGPRPPGHEVRHLNGDQTDARAINLAWGTHSENVLDLVRHGRHVQARKTACPAGHAYDTSNTYVDRAGARHCRTCRRQRSAARRQLLSTA